MPWNEVRNQQGMTNDNTTETQLAEEGKPIVEAEKEAKEKRVAYEQNVIDEAWIKALYRVKAENIRLFPFMRQQKKWAVIGSKGNGVYLVERTDDLGFKYVCDCEQFTYRQLPCKHAAAVAQLPQEIQLRKDSLEARRKQQEEITANNQASEELVHSTHSNIRRALESTWDEEPETNE